MGEGRIVQANDTQCVIFETLKELQVQVIPLQVESIKGLQFVANWKNLFPLKRQAFTDGLSYCRKRNSSGENLFQCIAPT